ncbi:response regulator transcription factor [Arthrobacter bambusae]|uniref:DNA-binding NarL/FixJ family response regulator n=1 Tax=Arthrobacter bambusae TaxID=1338426 RepID=A0AAW8DG52_9MICC|nr:response regulator transcription factor [Arthrobacter bambusae]MDP9905614.1 DNA-binding NarL/FixJ family response regulator [Arthrobacter bambusae]MDQ0127304.1 DNA-binding NarL/FixJ family response regulator [Arthrobacter bambusae]MDQ0178646.1 DNA-binding NarL/FixJ family response regulator [Arthrobacter bambusae]
MNVETIRACVIDDHEATMIGLEVGMHREGKVYGVTFAGMAPTVDALLKAGRGICDVVALDLQLADGSRPGENTARLITAGYKVLVFTSGDNQAYLQEALASGALGVSLKSEPLSWTFDKLRRVAAGETIDNLELASAIEVDIQFVEANLSEREKECLALYATGFGQAQVARRMNIAASTVKTNIDRIREKFEAAGRPADTKVDLYIRAVEDGIIPPPQPKRKRAWPPKEVGQ